MKRLTQLPHVKMCVIAWAFLLCPIWINSKMEIHVIKLGMENVDKTVLKIPSMSTWCAVINVSSIFFIRILCTSLPCSCLAYIPISFLWLAFIRIKTSNRPGGTSSAGKGVDIKHNSYARYLARKKSANLATNTNFIDPPCQKYFNVRNVIISPAVLTGQLKTTSSPFCAIKVGISEENVPIISKIKSFVHAKNCILFVRK